MRNWLRLGTAAFVTLAAGLAVAAGELRLPAGGAEIVVGENAPKTVRFAAREMGSLLGGVFGREVPTVERPTAGKMPIVLGAAACGTEKEAAALGRDEFVVDVRPDGVRIYGRDDPKADPDKVEWCAGLWMQVFERATLFGVYEFLERHAGVRMYFPGELGTITPHRDALAVPLGKTAFKPEFLDRSFSFSESGAWFEGEDRNATYHPQRMTNGYRLRMQTDYKPCVHGINALSLDGRFKKDHPEWFTLNEKGERINRLCWSSGIREELYKDVRAYFRGEACETRGFHGRKWINNGWPYNMRFGRWADLMPQDGFQRCHCAACRAAVGAHTNNFATMTVWGTVAEIANRLKREGVPGKLTCMAYWPYHDIPELDIPDNVEVMVATAGPWSEYRPGGAEKDLDQARVWVKKLGRPVWLWTYANKWGNSELPDVPQLSMRSWGSYYKKAAGLVTGTFAESESDRFLYNYLNYYVFSKVAWDRTTDVESLLAEHHRLMFGAASGEMAKFFDALEKKWTTEVVGNYESSPLGPVMATPSDRKLWTQVYAPAFMRQLDGLLARAASKVGADTLEAKRIALFRREYYDPLKTRGDRFRKMTSLPKGWKPLSPFVAEGTNRTAVSWSLGGAKADPRFPRLEPGARYRLTFFFRTEDVKKVSRKGEGGACGNIWAGTVKKGYNIWFPNVRWYLGTTDWMRQEYEFQVDEKIEDLSGSYLRFALQGACGKLWIDDVKLEKVTDAIDDLMPRPKVVRRNRNGRLTAPGALANVTYAKGKVAGTPDAVRAESYEIRIEETGVKVTAPDARGERYARLTLKLLGRLSGGRPVACCTIRDWPSLRWRGYMNDCGRNYLDVKGVKAILDVMGAYKMNLFHWHLSDYHGWRLESKKYPQLNRPEAYRRQIGRYYTQDEFREIVRYAAERGITVMPELDVPGHSLAFRLGMGIDSMSAPGTDRVVSDLFRELCSLAGEKEMPFVHIGTDEVRVEPEYCDESWPTVWARTINACGRRAVVWAPGKKIDPSCDVVDMAWYDCHVTNTVNDAFDAARMYNTGWTPFDVLTHAAFTRACRWDIDEKRKLGAITCTWHDDNVGDDTLKLFRECMVFPSIVAMADNFWASRPFDDPVLAVRMPLPGERGFAFAQDLERRILAQRDRVLAKFPHPFAFFRQTAMRWRIVDEETGEVLHRDLPQGTVVFNDWQSPKRALVAKKSGRAAAETWIYVPETTKCFAWIDLTAINGVYLRAEIPHTPDRGEWNAFDGKVELNGVALKPPHWKQPGMKNRGKEDSVKDVPYSSRILETPMVDEMPALRPGYPIVLKKGWNHVKVSMEMSGRGRHHFSFAPFLGEPTHPRDVPGIRFSATEPLP